MFENCTLKYVKDLQGNNYGVKIIHPTKDDGSTKTITAPMDEENMDYQNILKWLEEGNTIEEAD